MPNIIEISGLPNFGTLGRRHLADGLSVSRRSAPVKSRTRSRKAAVAPKRRGPQIPLQRKLEIVEKFLNEGNKRMAFMWARQLENQAKLERDGKMLARAQSIVKMLRGDAVLQTMAGLGDIDAIVLGRMAGIW